MPMAYSEGSGGMVPNKRQDALVALALARASGAAANVRPVVAQGTNAALVNFGADIAQHALVAPFVVAIPASGHALVNLSVPYDANANAASGTTITFNVFSDAAPVDTIDIDVDVLLSITEDSDIYNRQFLLTATPGNHTISASIQQSVGGGIALGTVPAGGVRLTVLTVP